MPFVFRMCWRLALALGILLAGGPPVGGAPTTPAPAPVSPQPPLPQSPVLIFRGWLEMTPAERAEALAEKPEPTRKVLQAKLAEYTALAPAERELRLQATELQWHLQPLLRTDPSDRAARLAHVPEIYRDLIAERLGHWDRIDPLTRNEILRHDWAIRYFVRLESATPADQAALRDTLPPERRDQFEREFVHWESLTPGKRQAITRTFREFFELPPAQQQRTLEVLPETERREIETTLRAFAQLPPQQRQLCLDSFRRLASLTPAQRSEFLHNADRWREMSPEDRATWRRLVRRLPPLPPIRMSPPLPPPPLPRSPVTSKTAP